MLVSEGSTVRVIDELSLQLSACARSGKGQRNARPAATVLCSWRSRFLPVAVAARSQKRRPIFQPGKRGSDLLWHLGKIDRRYKSARGGRGPSSLKPLIVVCRQVQQSSLGKLVCVLSKAATALGMRFQEVGIHGNLPTQQSIQFCTAHPLKLRASERLRWAVDKRDGHFLGARDVPASEPG